MKPIDTVEHFLRASLSGEAYDPALEALNALADIEAAVAAVITALDVPRNRMGKLDGDSASGEPLRNMAVLYGVPGSRDAADQAVHVLRAVMEKSW